MTKVSILRCHHYDASTIKAVLEKHLQNIGFDPGQFHNKKVAIKPNFLYATPPEKAIITHPEFSRAVAEIVKENGGSLYLIESPALDSINKALRNGKYLDMVGEFHITIPDMKKSGVLFYEKNKRFKRFKIAKACAEMDIIINIPKLKTHPLTCITCAAKNLFGIIPGLEKPRWHQRARTKMEFSQFILDFNEALLYGFKKRKLFLHLVDGIIGQEGDGPGTAGTPRGYGITIAGTHAIAVDYIAATFLGINEKEVFTISHGFERNINGISSAKDITIVGDDITTLGLQNIKRAGSTYFSDIMRKWPLNTSLMQSILLRWFSKKPVPAASKCVLCYKCKDICPVRAISNAKKNKKTPDFNYKKCIRCFCCQEICPEAAIGMQ